MKIGLKVKLDAALVGESPPVEFASESALLRPVNVCRRWRLAFPSRDCPIDPRLMEVVTVSVDGLGIGKADFVEASDGILVLAGAWPTAIAEILYA